MPKKDNWTPEMYAKLAELYPQFSKPEIKAMTGWSIKEMTYRTGKMGIIKGNKSARKLETVDTINTDQFIRDNFEKYSNKELMQLLGWKLYQIRAKCYELGLYRMKLEYWTAEQEAFLIGNYRFFGDKEMAEVFQQKWPKNKPWTLKHIEKKRGYLNLKRTPEEISAIRDRNVELGCFNYGNFKPRWLFRGITKEGDIRMGRIHNGTYVPYIKVNGHFILWSRYTWEQINGPVPTGMLVIFKNDPSDYINGIESLQLVTRQELVMRMVQKAGRDLSDNFIVGQLSYGYPEIREAIKANPELINIKRKLILLSRAIKQTQNGRAK